MFVVGIIIFVGWLFIARRQKEYSLKIQALQFKKVMLQHDREIVQHKGTGCEFVEPSHYLQKQVLHLSSVLVSDSESLLVLTSREGCSWRGTNSVQFRTALERLHKCSTSLFSSFFFYSLLCYSSRLFKRSVFLCVSLLFLKRMNCLCT